MTISFSSLLSGIIGAILGSVLTAWISWTIFQKQDKISRYLNFIDDIDSALNKSKELKTAQEQDKKYIRREIELLLNKAYSKSMVAMNDKLYFSIEKLLNNNFDKQNRNLIYYLMRKDIFRWTKVDFADLLNKYMKLKN